MPSKEHDASSVVSLRLPDALLERLDRYLDWVEVYRAEKSSRNQTLRQALTQWLDTQEEQGGRRIWTCYGDIYMPLTRA